MHLYNKNIFSRNYKLQKKLKIILLTVFIIFFILISNYIIFKKYILPYQKKAIIKLYLDQNTIKTPILKKDLRRGERIEIDDITYVFINKNIIPKNLIDLSRVNLSKDYRAVMNIPKNTVILSDFFKTAYLDDDIYDTSRLIEIDYLDLNYLSLKKGDFIDVRIEEKPAMKDDDKVNTNNYKNSIVLSKKKIIEFNEEQMILKLDEAEIQNLGCAVYQMANYNSYIYFTKYVNPQTQDKAQITYNGSDELNKIIKKDKFAVEKAKVELKKRLEKIEENNQKMNSKIKSLSEYIEIDKNIKINSKNKDNDYNFDKNKILDDQNSNNLN